MLGYLLILDVVFLRQAVITTTVAIAVVDIILLGFAGHFAISVDRVLVFIVWILVGNLFFLDIFVFILIFFSR